VVKKITSGEKKKEGGWRFDLEKEKDGEAQGTGKTGVSV